MGETMTFPETVEEFMEQYKIVDREQVYTNGAELVPIFRMKQWFEHEKAQLYCEGTTSDTISRQWLLECVDEGWIKFDTEKDANRFIHLVRDIAPTAQPVVTDTNVGDTISRQAAINTLEGGAEFLRRVLDVTDLVGVEREKYAWGLGLYESCIADVKELPSAQPEPQWIPVSEGLPKKDGRYQVTRHDYVTNTEFIDILWYEKNTWWDRQATGDYAVTAWMPLPERYVRPADADTAQGGLESAT